MQTAALVLAIVATIFSLLGFCAGVYACIEVLGFKRSTHRITQLPPIMEQETVVEDDLPQHIRDQLPSPPERLTAAQYLQYQARQLALDEFDDL